MGKNEITQKVEQSGHQKIKFAICDIDGILRAKTIHLDKFLEIAENSISFCDVVFGWDVNDHCYDNVKLTSWETGYPDKKAKLDLSTYRTIPWNNNIPYFLGDFSSTDNEIAACPRSLLKKVRDQFSGLGYKATFSQEFEWFNFIGTPNELVETGFQKLTTLTSGMFGYSQLRPSLHQEYFNELFDLLSQFNIPLEALHTETGPGVYEAAIRHDEILSAADKATLFKTAVKEIAYRHGIIASFMAKWNENLPGCSGHIHQSVWDKEGEKNLFYSDNKDTPMSKLMENYLSGQLLCLPEILPMYAPTINSYKRLRDGAWAPTTVSWGKDNRTTAIRMINGDEKSTRLEMRVPGSDSNPYLAMAASLASGMYGIINNLKLDTPAIIGSAYSNPDVVKLPSNLMDASNIMSQSKIANELFGEAFVEHFTKTREWEWREFSKSVTDWELKRYFEII